MPEAVAALPAVDVVVATRDRPEMLRRALDAILGQDYDGPVRCSVVFDRSEVDTALELDSPTRQVRVMANSRSPGLAGARNTGILAGSGALVAFCDDDDEWLPGKLSAQVLALQAAPGSVIACTGITVVRGETCVPRVLDRDRVTHAELVRSRLTELHPSTFLLRRDSLLGPVGLVEEQVPHGYGEDYDLLLRASLAGPVVNVPQAHCRVYWHPQSYYASRWPAMADGLEWLLARHPEFQADPPAYGRVAGQVAFARAASGRRSQALRWAGRTWRADVGQPRAYLAVLVAGRLLQPDAVMRWLNARGRGI